MASNHITVLFDECEPAPANGYRIEYRPQGSSEAFRVWPSNFTTSPAQFTDTQDPAGTEYEGNIMGDCGGGMYGVGFPWRTGVNSPGGGGGEESPPEVLLRINNFSGLGITGIFTVPAGGGPGDTRLVTCDEGYPLAAGDQSQGSIHADHNGDSDLELIVFFDSVASIVDRVHVTDSDNVQDCEAGTGVAAVIGVTGPFRFNNAEDWEITVNNTSC